MAKKTGAKSKKTSKKSRRSEADILAEVEQIIDEMRDRVALSMSPKSFASDTVENSLREVMRPKVRRRLESAQNTDGKIWDREKKNVLICADHMGQIAKLLAKGDTVDLSVADAARIAVKSDEHCRRGAAGGGDWCF